MSDSVSCCFCLNFLCLIFMSVGNTVVLWRNLRAIVLFAEVWLLPCAITSVAFLTWLCDANRGSYPLEISTGILLPSTVIVILAELHTHKIKHKQQKRSRFIAHTAQNMALDTLLSLMYCFLLVSLLFCTSVSLLARCLTPSGFSPRFSAPEGAFAPCVSESFHIVAFKLNSLLANTRFAVFLILFCVQNHQVSQRSFLSSKKLCQQTWGCQLILTFSLFWKSDTSQELHCENCFRYLIRSHVHKKFQRRHRLFSYLHTQPSSFCQHMCTFCVLSWSGTWEKKNSNLVICHFSQNTFLAIYASALAYPRAQNKFEKNTFWRPSIRSSWLRDEKWPGAFTGGCLLLLKLQAKTQLRRRQQISNLDWTGSVREYMSWAKDQQTRHPRWRKSRGFERMVKIAVFLKINLCGSMSRHLVQTQNLFRAFVFLLKSQQVL